jgi:putative exporter of polyketide antibiotics
MITLEMAIALLAAGIAPKHTKLTYHPLSVPFFVI